MPSATAVLPTAEQLAWNEHCIPAGAVPLNVSSVATPLVIEAGLTALMTSAVAATTVSEAPLCSTLSLPPLAL